MKKVPKEFLLVGHKIEVKRVSEEEMLAVTDGDECYGVFVPERLLILLLKPSKKIKASVLIQTFWHEYAHALLWVLSHPDYQNEKVVDQLGHLLKQTHDTFKF